MPELVDTGDVLGCGALVVDVVDQVDAGRLEPADSHQAHCRYCRSALRDAATSRQALDLLRATSEPVPAGLVERVMHEVRRDRRTGSTIELAPGSHRPGRVPVPGSLRVHQQVVADLARVAATTVPGVTVARSSAVGRIGPPGAVDVDLGLLTDGRTPLPDLAVAVRRAVRAALVRAIGAQQVQVELTALDVLPPD